jgi:hypothetical protein
VIRRRRVGGAIATLAIVAALGACASQASTRPAVPSNSAPSATNAPAGSPQHLIALRLAEPPLGMPRYSRTYFGDGWTDPKGDCRNTRADILIASSHTKAVVQSCRVVAGTWRDPWTGKVTNNASQFDIDHTVPLGNAWVSGAWKWSRSKRIAYANDIRDADQLIPISASANRAKGDDGPELWRPPLRSSWCRYALDWDHIKARWGLTATHAEWRALLAMVKAC